MPLHDEAATGLPQISSGCALASAAFCLGHNAAWCCADLRKLCRKVAFALHSCALSVEVIIIVRAKQL